MTHRRWWPLLVAAAVLTLGGGAASAASPLLGHTPNATEGGCTLCSAFQLGDSESPNSYEAPFDGVLISSRFYVGPFAEAPDYVQARTFRRNGGASATVVSEGDKHPISGLSTGPHSYFERIPIAAGDVLGGRFDTTPFVDGTPHIFATAAAGDEIGFSSSPGPDLGDTFTATTVANRRVNMSAVLEPDADGDGFGDVSQDLCPGSPHAFDACTGSLFGSPMQGPYFTAGTCTYDCLRVQLAVGGSSTAVPVGGVVVRWRLRAPTSGSYRIRTLAPTGGSSYSIAGSSAVESVAPSAAGTMVTFQTRLPVPAGGYVGLVPPKFKSQTLRDPALPGSTMAIVNDAPDGGNVALGGYSPLTAEAFYDADIEPDADGDGFGDISQDSCPANPATQGDCPEPAAAAPLAAKVPTCRGRRASIVGTSGRDRLKGTGKADVIVGLAGNDTIKALAGNDLVCAGNGKDTVFGGPGKDRLLGEKGADHLFGGPGKDTLAGGPGKDLQRQ